MPLALPPSLPAAASSSASSSSSRSASAGGRPSSSSAAAPAGSAPDAQDTGAVSTFFASLSRTLLFVVGMMLKRPSRLFRPSRISSIAFLRALAKRDNLSLTPRSLYRLARSYGPWSLVLPLVPPIVLNTVLTTLLFATHSGLATLLAKTETFRPRPHVDAPSSHSPSSATNDTEAENAAAPTDESERSWLSRSTHGVRHPTAVSALAGFGAGVVQSTLAIPVERAVKFVGRVIAGGGSSSSSGASGALASAPPPASSTPAKAVGVSARPAPHAGGSAAARKATLAWLAELRSTGPASASPLSAAGGWRGVSKLGFAGWRWGAAKDGVGYAVFFATFDTSRRLALHVRRLVSSVQTTAALNPVRTTDRPRVRAFFGLEDGLAARQDEEEEGALGYEGSRWARTSQAVVLVAGGMLAGQLFLLSTRPFDAVLRLLASPAHLPTSSPGSRSFTRSYLLSHLRHPLHPAKRNPRFRTAALAASAKPLPALPLIKLTAKTKGWRWFFRPPQTERGAADGSAVHRLGWALVKVGPWGGGFLAFAWLGGEI